MIRGKRSSRANSEESRLSIECGSILYGEVGTLVKHFCLENTSGFDDLRVLVHGENDGHQEEDGNHNSGVLTHRWLRKVTCYSCNPVGSKSVLDYLRVMLSEGGGEEENSVLSKDNHSSGVLMDLWLSRGHL